MTTADGQISPPEPPTPRRARWRAPLRLRTTFAFGAIALAVASLVALVCFVITRTTLITQREDAAERQAFLNARAVRSALRVDGTTPLDALSRVQTSSGGAGLLKVDGKWFTSVVGAGAADVPEALLDSVTDGSAARQRIDRSGVPTVAVGTPVVEAGAVYVELVPMDDVADTLGLLRRSLSLAAVAAAALGALGGWASSGRLLRPVRRMASAANSIREGALDRRLEADGDPDLEPLVTSFNEMVGELHTRIEREARFASDVSHEMRSPLATMTAALSITRRRVNDPAGLEALGMLEGEVERFSELVTDLLEISRAEAGVAEVHLETVEVVSFVQKLLDSTDHGGVKLDARCPADCRMSVDKRRIGQVLTNLLVNADNYAGGATVVRISDSASEVVIEVEDDGPGIPDHQRSYVFERFARGDNPEAPGTGLGLALVQEHVRLHGGTVEVRDGVTGGACFVVCLPRSGS